MPERSPDDSRSPQQSGARWPIVFLDRLPVRYAWAAAAILLLGIASLILEAWLKATTGLAADWREGNATLVVVLYILTHLRLIKDVSIEALAQLRAAVRISDNRYEQIAARLIRPRPWIEAMLGVLALALGVVFFVLPPDQLRALPHQTPGAVLALALIFLFYVISVALLLSLVYTGIRNAFGLAELARQPLTVNVFDPGPLLVFGRLSLLHSLAFVGVFLIPLVIIGPPQQGGGWLVIGLSTLSLLALFLPLWGVHRQIVKAREQVLASICEELMAVQAALVTGLPKNAEALKTLAERAEALSTFRKNVLSGPSWPFRDFSAVLRAITAAASPLIYLVLNQLIQTYVFPLFSVR